MPLAHNRTALYHIHGVSANTMLAEEALGNSSLSPTFAQDDAAPGTGPFSLNQTHKSIVYHTAEGGEVHINATHHQTFNPNGTMIATGRFVRVMPRELSSPTAGPAVVVSCGWGTSVPQWYGKGEGVLG